MITKSIATSVPLGTIFEHNTLQNADGTPLRCRVNGKCKTWKTRPEEFRLPVKHGLKTCFYLTQANCHEWNLENQ
jgi:hypothetical protein